MEAVQVGERRHTPEQVRQAILRAGRQGLSDAVNGAGWTLAGLAPLHWSVNVLDSAELSGHASWGDYTEERGQEVAEQWARALGLDEPPPSTDGTRTWRGELPLALSAGELAFRRIEVWCVADRRQWDADTGPAAAPGSSTVDGCGSR